MKNKKIIAIFILILVLSMGLRIYRLNEVPVELFGDELDVGYHAYSLLKTGKDYSGHFLPTYISSFAEARAPLFIYSAIPFVAIFGLNEWGVRLSAVFFGILGVVLIFFFIKELFRNEKLALFSSFLLAITPWHLHYSRAGFEVTLLLVLFLEAVLLFHKSLKENKYLLILSFVIFGLTPYTYSTANLFLPLLIVALTLVFGKELLRFEKKWLLISLLTFLIILIPFIKSLYSGQAGDRFSKISIFSDQTLIDKVILQRSQEQGGRFFHNKLTIWGKEIISNYLNSFSPQFLFLSGDPNPRHGVGKQGELFLIFVPLFLVGIWQGIRNIRDKEFQLIIFWLLASPLPASLTQGGGNHATRLFLMLPPLIILVSLGFFQIFEIRRKLLRNSLIILVIFFLFLEMTFYLHYYFIDWPKDSWRFWHYGYKKIMQQIAKNENNFQQIVFNNSHEPILLRFLFWTKKDPRWFHDNFKGDKEIEEIFSNFRGFRVGERYIFGRITGEEKTKSLFNFLNNSMIYLGFQGDEIPGTWNWKEDPPEGIKVIYLAKEYFSETPFIYLLTKK